MKQYITLLALLLASLFANGQMLTPEVIAVAGDYNTNQGYSLNWTLGETVTETFIKEDEQFTQGFQQAYIYEITGLHKTPLADRYTIEVYPNPAELFFFVKIDSYKNRGPVKMILYNMLGSKLDETTLEPELNTKKIEIARFRPTLFNLVLSDDKNRFIQSFKIVKVK